MTITCLIEYKINPSKQSDFEKYANNWGTIIPKCGGELLGYFLPHEGTNDTAFGLISFDSLASYEQYRKILKDDVQGKENFRFAQNEKFIVRENRTFLKPIASTYNKMAEATL